MSICVAYAHSCVGNLFELRRKHKTLCFHVAVIASGAEERVNKNSQLKVLQLRKIENFFRSVWIKHPVCTHEVQVFEQVQRFQNLMGQKKNDMGVSHGAGPTPPLQARADLGGLAAQNTTSPGVRDGRSNISLRILTRTCTHTTIGRCAIQHFCAAAIMNQNNGVNCCQDVAAGTQLAHETAQHIPLGCARCNHVRVPSTSAAVWSSMRAV